MHIGLIKGDPGVVKMHLGLVKVGPGVVKIHLGLGKVGPEAVTAQIVLVIVVLGQLGCLLCFL